MSRNSTNTRARGFCAAWRATRRRVFGSMRVSCGPAALDDDALELLDFLGSPALEDLEVVLREVGDRRAVLRRIDVDADVVRLGAEGRRLVEVPASARAGDCAEARWRRAARRLAPSPAVPSPERVHVTVLPAGPSSVYHRPLGEQRLDPSRTRAISASRSLELHARGLDRLADADADVDRPDDAAALAASPRGRPGSPPARSAPAP